MNDSPPDARPPTADAWNDERARVANRIAAGPGGFGIATAAQLAGKSGIEMLQAMLAGELPAAPISRTLDFLLIDVAPGRAVFQGRPSFDHYNPMGTAHGGWYATLLDSALGCAVHTLMPAGWGYATAELSVNIVRAATASTGPLRAIGEVVHSGRQLATAEARIVDAAGKLYAHGTTTCLVFEARSR